MAKVLLGVLFLLTNGRSINFFSLKQDVEIGSESAKEAVQSLSLVRDLNIAGYFLTIGQRLSQNSTLPALRYHFRIVNSREINSLGLPGGGVYIYRGLLQMPSNDDELAAILAHAIAHIASLNTSFRHARASGEFRAFQTSLERLPYPIPKTVVADTRPDSVSKIFTHPQDFYRLGYPDGWQVTRTSPNGAIIAPTDGVHPSRNGDDVTHGVMFDLFDIAVPDRSLSLEQATNRLIVFLRQRNQSLRVVPRSEEHT